MVCLKLLPYLQTIEVLSFQKGNFVEMSKEQPFPLMQQNEAEMFQQAVNNNFNPSSGGLTYKYQNSFLKM